MKAYCHKTNNHPFEMKFEKSKIYDYYITPYRDIFVLFPAEPYKWSYHCLFDDEHFKESFYDLNELRKIKLKQIERRG